MTAVPFNVAPHLALIAPAIRKLATRLGEALDAFVEARMRNAVPQRYLRGAQRDLNRIQPLMHGQQSGACEVQRTTNSGGRHPRIAEHRRPW